MTVVRLQPRGLLVYSPVAPTPECVGLMRQLEQAHGPVQYIILSTVTGIGHKAFCRAFCPKVPQAEVYVTPGQWSYPLNLPCPGWDYAAIVPVLCPRIAPRPLLPTRFDYAVLQPHQSRPRSLCRNRLLPPGIPHPAGDGCSRFHPQGAAGSVTARPLPPAVSCEGQLLLTPSKTLPIIVARDGNRIALFAFYFRPGTLDVADTGENAEGGQSVSGSVSSKLLWAVSVFAGRRAGNSPLRPSTAGVGFWLRQSCRR